MTPPVADGGGTAVASPGEGVVAADPPDGNGPTSTGAGSSDEHPAMVASSSATPAATVLTSGT